MKFIIEMKMTFIIDIPEINAATNQAARQIPVSDCHGSSTAPKSPEPASSPNPYDEYRMAWFEMS